MSKFQEGWAIPHASKRAHYLMRCARNGYRSICGRMGRIFAIRIEESAEQCKHCRSLIGAAK